LGTPLAGETLNLVSPVAWNKSVFNRAGMASLTIQLDPITPALVTGKILLIKDKLTDASKRKILALSKDSTITTPAALSSGDPLVGGATLRVENPVTGEFVQYSLPGGAFDGTTGWKRLGTNPDAKNGYKYLDKNLANSPCKIVLAKPGGFKASGAPKPGLVRALCKGSGIAYTLDEGLQGEVAVTLQLGTGIRYCMSLAGTLIKDQSTGAVASGVGVFKRKDAPAPGACPI
jgi:hypothetical protein